MGSGVPITTPALSHCSLFSVSECFRLEEVLTFTSFYRSNKTISSPTCSFTTDTYAQRDSIYVFHSLNLIQFTVGSGLSLSTSIFLPVLNLGGHGQVTIRLLLTKTCMFLDWGTVKPHSMCLSMHVLSFLCLPT